MIIKGDAPRPERTPSAQSDALRRLDPVRNARATFGGAVDRCPKTGGDLVAVESDLDDDVQVAPGGRVEQHVGVDGVEELADFGERGAVHVDPESRREPPDGAAGFLQPPDDPRRKALQAKVKPLLAGCVADGRLGMKTGAGFYNYPAPAYQKAGFLDAAPVEPAVVDAAEATAMSALLHG